MELLAVAHLPKKKALSFWATRRFITMFTRGYNWSLSWARLIEFTISHSISLRPILIASSYLHLDNPIMFPTRILYTVLISPTYATGIAMDYGLDDRGSIPKRGKRFYLQPGRPQSSYMKTVWGQGGQGNIWFDKGESNGAGEICLMRNLFFYTPCHALLGWSSQGGWGKRDL
jgi:hypothetical protein